MSGAKKDEGSPAEPAEEAKVAKGAEGETPLVRVARPDQDEFSEAMKAVDDQMAAVDTKIRAVNATMAQKNRDMSSMVNRVERAKSDLVRFRRRPAKLRSECGALEKKLEVAEKALNIKKAANNKVQAELSSMINNRGGGNITKAIDNKIRDLDYQQKTESMSLKEEKNLVKEIGQLRAMRKRASTLKIISTRQEESKVRGIREDTRRKMAQLTNNDSQVEKKTVELKKLEDELTARRGKDMPALEKKRNELRKQKSEKRKEKKDISDSFYNLKREFDTYTREIRSRKFKKEKAERDEWRKEQDEVRKKWEEEKAKEQPWQEEIAVVETVIGYIRATMPKETEEKAEVAAPTTVTLSDGTVVEAMGKSSKHGAAAFRSRNKKKKKKRGRNRNRQSEHRPIQHSFKVIQMFSKMNIPLPHYQPDLETSLEAAQKALDMWKTKPRAAKKAPKKKGSKAKGDATPPAAPAVKKTVSEDATAAAEETEVAVEEEVAVDEEVAVEEAADEDSKVEGTTEEAGETEEAADEAEETEAPVEEVEPTVAETVAVESESVEDVPVTEDADEVEVTAAEEVSEKEEAVEEVAAKTEEVAVKAEYDEYVCYDDDACLGKAAPALDSLEVVQGDAKCLTYTDKPTVILFWAKFLKWQVHSALVGCEKLWKTGTVNVVGIATDPKKSAVERHISKGECPTTYGLAFDAPAGSPGGVVKNLFKEVCAGDMKTPCVILVNTEGKIVWRQAFSSGKPYTNTNFEDQVDALVNGKALTMNGPTPEDESSSEDEGDDEDVVELKDPMAADVAW